MNEIVFVGTGAADWDINEKGNFFRRNSAALVNNNLLVDCGEHIFDFADSNNEPDLYKNVTDIIITHNHSDHIDGKSVSEIAENQKIRVGCCGEIQRLIGENINIDYTTFKPYEEQSIGEYKITPLLANHYVIAKGDDYAFHYIIETSDGKKIFYGLDGAWFLRPSWEEMKKHKFDVMVLDCTVGDSEDWRIFEHNTIPMLRHMTGEIRNRGMLSENGMIVASHLARTLHVSHAETEKILKEFGVTAAYDGFKISF